MSDSKTLRCRNCGRRVVQNRDPQHRWARKFPKRPWVHRLEDFDPKKPIDCFDPEPQATQEGS
jgi:hypothetical protein